MKKYYLLILLLISMNILFAGVGSSLSSFLKSDFSLFFNISEVGRQYDGSYTVVNYKTGGFKEFIDLKVKIDSNGIIQRSDLIINRQWLNKQMHFANDIMKSYLLEFAGRDEKKYISPLSELIWEGNTDNSHEFRSSYEVILGNRNKSQLKSGNCVFRFSNKISVNEQHLLVLSVYLDDQKWNFISPDENLFLDKEFMEDHNLVLESDSGFRKIWTSISQGSEVMKVEDMRWVFEDDKSAGQYYGYELILKSENADPVKNEMMELTEQFNIYFASNETAESLRSEGYPSKIYYFIFRINNVVAKVSIYGGSLLSLNEAMVYGIRASELIRFSKIK